MKKFPILIVVALVLAACAPGSLVGGGATPVAEATASRTQPTPEVVTTPRVGQECEVINDYQLQDLPEVSVEPGGYLHVEYFQNGQPEYETVLPSGRYTIIKSLAGHVWEYSPSCTAAQVLAQVRDHIARRLQLKANNKGYVHYEGLINKLFKTVVMTGNADVPAVLPKP